jgi:hypothetical protein
MNNLIVINVNSDNKMPHGFEPLIEGAKFCNLPDALNLAGSDDFSMGVVFLTEIRSKQDKVFATVVELSSKIPVLLVGTPEQGLYFSDYLLNGSMVFLVKDAKESFIKAAFAETIRLWKDIAENAFEAKAA